MTEPVSLTITLDLDQYLARFHGYDHEGEPREGPTTLADVVIELAARQLVERSGRDAASMASDEMRAAIRERLGPIVDAALAAPLQRTNEYGAPRGEPTTIHEEVVRLTHEHLTKHSRSYGRESLTVVQDFIRTEVEKAIKADLAETMTKARNEVMAAVRGNAAKLIAESVERLAAGKAAI